MYINRVYPNATLTSLSSSVTVDLLLKPARETGSDDAKNMLLLRCSSNSAVAHERLFTSPTSVTIINLQPAKIMTFARV